MISEKKIATIIPVYNVGKKIIELLDLIPDYVDKIFLVDDNCPLKTGMYAEKKFANKDKLKVIFNEINLGVGGAVKIGYQECLNNDYDIIVKIDGDYQMDPLEISKIVEPLLSANYDYVKGNRFLKKTEIKNYPVSRFYGNIFLSFMSKLSSGYWDLFDPINGYTAIKRASLEKLELENIDNRYYFESDMLFNLYNLKTRVKDVPVTIKYYNDQVQNLSVFKESFNFLFKNLNRIYKRIKLNYFDNNFGLGSFFVSFFLIFFTFTTTYGGYNYIYHLVNKTFAPTGVVLISSISCLLMFLSLMIFLIIDNLNNPNK